MKRIALLLAAVVSGSGCIITDTCDPMELSITWTPLATDGLPSLCQADALSADVNVMDVYVDGVFFDTLDCDLPGVTLTDYDISSGWHDIMLEGRASDLSSYVIIREMLSVNVDSCGVTYSDMYPGETNLQFNASVCATPDSGITEFQYSLTDVNYSSPIPLATDVIVPCSLVSGEYEIDVGPVPYGYYSIVYAEEYDSIGYLGYSNCSMDFSTFSDTAGPRTLTMYAQAACPP